MIAMLVVVGAVATPLVTGNGYGYAVVDSAGAVTKLYAHPYRFMRKNPDNVDGVSTTNLVKHAAWKGEGAAAVAYVNESHVIRVQTPTFVAEFFEPFALARNVLMTRSTGGCFEITWEHPLAARRQLAKGATLYTFRDVPESVTVVAATDEACPHELALIVGGHDVPRLPATVDSELASLEAWRVPAPATLSPQERTLWRQSETILRMAQIREPHVNGLINASLPNGNWFIPWVRDGAFAIVGLTRMGHRAEARAALDAWFNAPPMSRMLHHVRNAPYRISTVRYFGDGTEDADTSGQPFQNVEFDSWGLALWAVGEYAARSGDRAWFDKIFATARDFIVKPIVANTDAYGDGLIMALDSSCWEQNNQPRQHYAYSTIAVIQGLHAFAKAAELYGRDTVDLHATITALEKGFAAAYVRDGVVHGVLGDSPKNDMDGAIVEGIADGVITDAHLIDTTLQRLDVLATGSGGYRRVTGPTEYERHEFILIDYAVARTYLKLGKRERAEAVADAVTKRALADHGLIPEMCVSFPSQEYPGAVGDPAGAVPMVGYGAGAFIIYVSERDA